MKLLTYYKIIGLILLTAVFPLKEGNAGNIIYPWRATAVIVEQGSNFNILFNNLTFQKIDSVKLISDFYNEILNIDSINTGRFEYDHYTKKAVNNQIWVKISDAIPEDLYNLFIYSKGQIYSSPMSVKIIHKFKKTHTFIHISDLHISRQWVGEPQKGYAKELELFSGFVKVANIISPDFILITGDNIMDYTMLNADQTGWGGERIYEADKRPLVEEKYKNLFWGANGFSGIYGLNSPTFLIPGNHDFYGVAQDNYFAKCLQWNELMGKRVHGFIYAGTRVILADDSIGDPVTEIPDSAPMSGIQGEVHEKFLEENGKGSLRILTQHKHNNVDTAFLNKNKINILLNGHNHTPHEEMIGNTPTFAARTGVVCRSGEIKNWEKNLGFFRIFNIDDDTFQCSDPVRFCQNPASAFEDFELNLTLKYKNPNDGTYRENKAEIKNLLPVDLKNCKIRFIMTNGKYDISDGEIMQTINNGKLSVVDVNFNIQSEEEKTIIIKPL